MRFSSDNSSQSESPLKLDYVNFNEDSAYIERTLHIMAENQMLITKRRSFKFYLRIILVSLLTSLYYCLILSMDKEIELVTAKIFHSIIIFLLTIIEYFLMRGHRNKKNSNDQYVYSAFTEKRYSKNNSNEDEHENENEKSYSAYGDIDAKEMFFYNVIYGMLSFTSEILLYYFLSLSAIFGVNIGTLYTLTGIEFLILVIRLPYFGVTLGLFQYVGTFMVLVLISTLFIYYVPDYNIIVIIFTAITVSVFKFIKYTIFEYLHNKTNNATKLIRESTYVDGIIGLLLLFFIISSKKGELLIDDFGNLMKLVLASFFYYFALKISLHREKHYYLYVIFSSFNFILISVLDYFINGRSFTLINFILIALLSLFSISSFIQDSAFTLGLKQICFNSNKSN